MAKSKKGGFFSRSFSLPSSRVRKGERIERNIEERQDEEEEIDEKELHNVLRMIKTLAVNAKKDFKKKKVYRYYCEEMIDRWIPDLKRLLRIRSREERRHREEAEAQRENDRRETQRELRNFSKGYDNKRNRTDELAALKNKHEDELVRQKKEHDDAMTALGSGSEIKMSKKHNLFSRSASLPSRSKNVQLLYGTGSPAVDTGLSAEEREKGIHEALREMKRLAISAKDKYKKDRKKKTRSSQEYVYDCQTLIQTSIPKLKQLLGINTLEEERAREQVLAEEENFRQGTSRDFKKWNQAFEGKKKYEDEIKNLNNQHKKEVASLLREKEGILQRLREMEKHVASLTEEKENLLTRLSQVAGARLRDNNPGISDLSDPNRPLKLNEKISELYDNEWTDAIEILETDQGEQAAIGTLLNIVMRCFRMCQHYAKNQLATITKALMLDEKVSTSVAKCAKDAQKTSSEVVINESSLHTIVWKDMESTYGKMATKCEPLINKCVQYCWLMCIQDPPMCLVDFGRGLEFNSNEMRSFTKSGKFVDFVVWPALYLHEDGPLLSKAVVQGSNHPAQQKQQTNQQRQHGDSMIRNNGVKIKHSMPDPKQQKTNAQTRGHLERINDSDNQSFNSETQRQHHDHYDGVYHERGRMNPRDYDKSTFNLPPLPNKGVHVQSRPPYPPNDRRNPQVPQESPKHANSGIPSTVYKRQEYWPTATNPAGHGQYHYSVHASQPSYGHRYPTETYTHYDTQYSQSKQNARYRSPTTHTHHTDKHSYKSTEL